MDEDSVGCHADLAGLTRKRIIGLAIELEQVDMGT